MWGTASINIENSENERVQFIGKPQKNQINGFIE